MASDKIVVLVTGANSGIGFDTAAAFAAVSSDYHVYVASRSVEKGEKALGELKKRGLPGTFSLVQLDVTDEKTVEAAAATVKKEFGYLDVLVNNAGIVSFAPTLKEQLRETFEVNSIGPAVVTEHFLPLLKKSNRGGRVIYVSSGLGSLGLKADPDHRMHVAPHMVYRMSKAALNMLALCHQVEYEPFGIKVFSMCPGYVVTNLTGEDKREERVKSGAGSSEVSAQTILSLAKGERDADIGKFLHKDGIYPW